MVSLRHPQLSRPEAQQTTRFEVIVLFTDIPGTAVALSKANEWAGELDARILVLVPCVVPYPLPVEKPAVAWDFLRAQFEILTARQSVETRVAIGLCRNRE